MIKAILFDLDDTLYDERQFVKGGFKAVSAHVSEKYGIDENSFYRTLLNVLKKEGRGRTFDVALDKFDLYEKDLVPKLVEIYRKHLPKLSLYPDVLATLSKLKKRYKLGLITDGNVTVQKRKIESLNIQDFFDVIVISDRYGSDMQKPNPFPYKKALERLRVKAMETVYVGDNPNKDFIAPKKLRMHTVRILKGRYKNTKLQTEFEADYEIKKLRNIFEILKKLRNWIG